jgi:hypothetical protein
MRVLPEVKITIPIKIRAPPRISKTSNIDAILGMRNFSRNFTNGLATIARSIEIAKDNKTEDAIFKTAARSIKVIIARRKKFTRPELNRLNLSTAAHPFIIHYCIFGECCHAFFAIAML